MNGIGKSIKDAAKENQNSKRVNKTEQRVDIASDAEPSQSAFIFIKMLLNTLSLALNANSESRRYFRKELQFASLADALQVDFLFFEKKRREN